MFPLQLGRQWSKDRKSLSVTARDTSLGERSERLLILATILANEKLRGTGGTLRIVVSSLVRFFSNFFATRDKLKIYLILD